MEKAHEVLMSYNVISNLSLLRQRRNVITLLQEIMEGLRVCREASIKQADEKEAELNEERKKNCNLKEKLNSIIASKVNI
jgi:hypothetical protein